MNNPKQKLQTTDWRIKILKLPLINQNLNLVALYRYLLTSNVRLPAAENNVLATVPIFKGKFPLTYL